MVNSAKHGAGAGQRTKDKGEHAAQNYWQTKQEQSEPHADPTRDSELAANEMHRRIKLY